MDRRKPDDSAGAGEAVERKWDDLHRDPDTREEQDPAAEDDTAEDSSPAVEPGVTGPRRGDDSEDPDLDSDRRDGDIPPALDPTLAV